MHAKPALALLDGSTRYELDLPELPENTSHAKVLELVGTGKRVLELGCASGYLTRHLVQRGCRVTAVELAPELAEKARPWCEQLLVGDVEQLELHRALAGETFDVVLCADILEHLVHPHRVLESARKLLAPGGSLVASIPNVTHVSVALELLKGNFDYRPLGLLDRSHVRFFSKRGVVHLLERSGYRVDRLDRTLAAPDQMELAQPLTGFGPELLRHVGEHDEAVTYQLIVQAVPFSDQTELARLVRERDDQHDALSRLAPAVAAASLQSLTQRLETEQVKLQRARSEEAGLRVQAQALQSHNQDLQRALALARTEAQTAREELARSQARRSRLRRRVRSLRQRNERLTRKWQRAAQPGHLEAATSGLQAELKALRAEIELLRRPLWQRLELWFLAAVAWIAQCLAGTARRRHPVELEPAHQLKPTGNLKTWESTGVDPGFSVRGVLPTGWVALTLEGSASPATSARVYLDTGTGFSEERAFSMGGLGARTKRLRRFVCLDGVKRMRLDPATAPGRVTVERFELRSVDPLTVATHALWQLFRRRGQRKDSRLPFLPWRLLEVARRELVADLPMNEADDYSTWVEENSPGEDALEAQRAAAGQLTYRPKFSILVPVYNPDADVLERCFASVLGQTYDHWELCLADDKSTLPHVRKLLERYARRDPRIKVIYREQNGHISAASNSALSIATGEFVALLDQDDELSPNALYENALALNEDQSLDLLYSDEDKLDLAGRRRDPYFKPDWSPELLLSQMYIGHLGVYRRTIVERIGGFRLGYQGSQDFDLALRFTEQTRRIRHLPKVLYHWRIIPGSTAASSEAKPYAYEAAQRALNDALARRRLKGAVEQHPAFRGHYIPRLEPDLSQRVAVIIPTRDRADLLGRCLQSLFERTRYPSFEVVVVDNGSTDAETFELLSRWAKQEPERFRVIRRDFPFNFSRLVNEGVSACSSELVVLLNNDTEVLDPDWMTAMAGYAQQPEIGAVGCKLLYPDGTIQHAGVLLLGRLVAAHSHERFDAAAPGYFGRLVGPSNYSAVTGACLMVRRSAFDEVQGFDPELPVAYNDVDFCLRLEKAGHRNVCLGFVSLLHRESQTRGYEQTPEQLARLETEAAEVRRRWGARLQADPYLNPNLRRDRTDFTLAVGRGPRA